MGLCGAVTRLSMLPRCLSPACYRMLRPLGKSDCSGQQKRGCSSDSSSTSTVALAYDVFDGKLPAPPLVFLHGLFGSKSNFHAIAKALVQKTGRKVLTLDARNHGSSPHSATMTYETMSADIRRLLEQLRIQRCILIGHSMGGKTAMALALQWPELVEGLVSVDISPSPLIGHSWFPTFISAMKNIQVESNIPLSTARRVAEEQLSLNIKDSAVRQFLLTNMVNIDGHYTWRINLEAILENLPYLLDFPQFHSPYPGPTLFLGGEGSPYISSDDYPEIERLFPEADIQYIPGAGHWVHADQATLFIKAITNFLLPT